MAAPIHLEVLADLFNKIGHERHFALRKMWIEMKPKWAAVACLDDRFQSATLPLIINWGF